MGVHRVVHFNIFTYLQVDIFCRISFLSPLGVPQPSSTSGSRIKRLLLRVYAFIGLVKPDSARPNLLGGTPLRKKTVLFFQLQHV